MKSSNELKNILSANNLDSTLWEMFLKAMEIDKPRNLDDIYASVVGAYEAINDLPGGDEDEKFDVEAEADDFLKSYEAWMNNGDVKAFGNLLGHLHGFQGAGWVWQAYNKIKAMAV